MPNIFDDIIPSKVSNSTGNVKKNIFDDIITEPKPDLATKIANAIKGGVKETGAQLQDLTTMPARLLGTPHPAMASELATKTIPKVASDVVEGVTKPLVDLEIPVLTPRNLKPLLKGDFKNLETTPVSPSALDLAIIAGIPAYQGGKSILSRVGWNKIMSDAIQGEKIKGAIMDNIGPLENIMAQGGIKLPDNLPLEDKVSVIISQAQKSPTLGDVLVKLSKGKLQALEPVSRGPVTDIRAEPGFASPEPPNQKIAPKTALPGDLALPESTITPKTTIPPIESPVIPVAPVGSKKLSITPTGTTTFESKPTSAVKIIKEDIISAMKPEEKSKYDSLNQIASTGKGNKAIYAADEMERIEKIVEKRLNKPATKIKVVKVSKAEVSTPETAKVMDNIINTYEEALGNNTSVEGLKNWISSRPDILPSGISKDQLINRYTDMSLGKVSFSMPENAPQTLKDYFPEGINRRIDPEVLSKIIEAHKIGVRPSILHNSAITSKSAALEDLDAAIKEQQTNPRKIIPNPQKLEDIQEETLSQAKPEHLLELIRMGHPDEEGYHVGRFMVMDELEKRGFKALSDLGWPTDLNSRYRNLYTGDEESLGDILNHGINPEFRPGETPESQVWSVMEHWKPAEGKNTERIEYLKEKLDRAKGALADPNNKALHKHAKEEIAGITEELKSLGEEIPMQKEVVKQGVIMRKSVDSPIDKAIKVEGFFKRDKDYLAITERPNPLYLIEGEVESLRKQGVREFSEEEAKTIIQEKQVKSGIIKPSTQKNRVKQAVSKEPKTIKSVVEETGILEPNVRRILGVGAKEGIFSRVDKGVYILNKNGKDIAYIHTGDAVEVLPKLAAEGLKADMVFLDIPYKTPAVTGGNRGVKYNLITTAQFSSVVSALKKIIRDENTPILYMYSQAKSGLKEMAKYNNMLLAHGFKPVAKGEYTKLQLDGVTRVRNMRGDIIEPEGILLLTQSGKFDKENPNLNFTLIRPKGYQTEKPAEMLKALIELTTDKGEVVLDPFAGSGVTGAEAIKSGREAVLVEKNPETVEKFIKPKLEEAVKGASKEKQMELFPKEKTYPKSSGQSAGMSEPLGESQDKAYMSDYTPQDHTTAVEMPELVKLAQELTGKAPIVAKLRGALGKFYGNKEGSAVIKIRHDIFKNPFLAGQVLTHEIGHLVDWLPDYTLSRGNLIGRLLTLKKFMQGTFGDLNNKEIKEELKAATIYWHPFNPDKAPVDYTKIRFSSKELYAESISMLLIQPEKLKELAPKFYRAFWDNINEKPEVKDALLGLQDFLNLGDAEKYKVRSEDLSKSFQDGESLFYDARNRYKLAQRSWFYKFQIQFIDKITPVIEKVKEAEKKGIKINPEDNPKYYLEDYNYIGGKIKNLLEEIHTEVIKPVEDKLTTLEDLGKYLFLNRVVTERADIANPLGHNRDTALKQLKFMEESLGKEKFDNLKSAAERFNLIMKRLLTEAEQSGLIKPDIFAEIITNPAYATFQVLDHLDDYVSSGIINQKGTLKNIANPFVSTTLKMISTRRAIERNNTNKSVVKFMQDTFPAEIEPAKIRRFGKYKAEAVEKENFGIIKVREEGKFKAYYVDPYIADSVNYTPTPTAGAFTQVISWLNKGWFRPVYVNLNLGFQSYNLIRDFKRAWKLNPHTSFSSMLAKYKEATPIAFRRIWGEMSDPVIKEMQENAMLSVTYNDITRGAGDQDESMSEYLLQQYGVLEKNKSLNPFIKLINFIEEIGNFIETLPKVTGYLSRKETGRPMKEIAHEVRVYSGSPDFLRKGEKYYSYNNFFLFSNAIKEGFRGDIEGSFKNPRTRSGYWWKTVATSILPKILMWLAAGGLFGEEIAKNYKKQSEYDKTNYFTIPMGFTPEGKAIYFRMPDDETGKLLSGMLWKSINMGNGSDLKDVFNIAGGQLPSLSPSLEIPIGWATYFSGGNPYDLQRGQTVLSRDEKTAGGVYALKPMFNWTVSKMGGGSFTATFSNNKTTGEKVLSLIPILGRFLRISDYGEKEQQWQDRQPIYQRKAERRLEGRR